MTAPQIRRALLAFALAWWIVYLLDLASRGF
jgi:hypothetical protein